MWQVIRRQSPYVKHARDCFAVGTMPDLAAYAATVPVDKKERKQCAGGVHSRWSTVSYDEALGKLMSGDLAGVPESDTLMSSLEDQIPMSHMWRTRMDVTGGVPNVAAYLAGQPLCMRRRERTMGEQGPLTIFCSLELSGGIGAKDMQKRGVTLLALVRLLSVVRPVECWVTCSIGSTGMGVHMLTRLESQPLDLARTAFLLTCPAVTRGLMYASGAVLHQEHDGREWIGDWAYGNADEYRKHAVKIYSSVVPPSSDVLYLPAAHLHDPCVTEPVTWLKKMVAKYTDHESVT